ncbi:hypothetical protein P7C70_g1342, partial [Phenoliferia sp. Uapishka_3]
MSELPPPTYTDSDAELLFQPSLAFSPTGVSSAPLARPVCVPQLDPSYDSPFVRGYPRELESSGISVEDWLGFCDGLNIAIIGSPPLQVVDKIGMAIGFVPNHWAMIAGIAIQTVAQTSLHVISKTLTDRYLRLQNEKFFSPRGLVVRLVRTPALRTLLSPPSPDTAPPSKFSSFMSNTGKTAQKVSLHVPVVRKIVNRFSDPVPAVPANTSDHMSTLAGRRLAQLSQEGLIAELDLDVPPAKTPEGLMDKGNELAVKMRKWKDARKEHKVDQKRQLLAIREGKGGFEGASSQSGQFGQFGPGARKARRAERRAQRDSRRGRTGSASRKLRTSVEIADRKEYNSTDSLLWIVLLNKEQDEEIQNREEADAEVEFLNVPDDEWEEEIDAEEEEEEIALEQEKVGLGGGPA